MSKNAINVIQDLKKVEKNNISKLTKKQDSVYNNLLKLRDDYEKKLKDSELELQKEKEDEIKKLTDEMSSKSLEISFSSLTKKYEKNKEEAKNKALEVLFT